MKSFNLKSSSSSWWKSALSVHGHRYFRGAFILILIFHMVLLLFPSLEEIQIPTHSSVKEVFTFVARLWPFPTFKMFSTGSLYIRQVLMKTLEISVILLYAVDLLPKIFKWSQGLLWRMLNILIVTFMVAQLPATLIEYAEKAATIDQFKLRVFSISLSFVLLCEILSIREQRTLRLKGLKVSHQKINSTTSLYSIDQKIDTTREYSWCEIIKHDQAGDCWIVIAGLIYDISRFVDVHPGGPMIYDGAGGDCTALWFSYHPSRMTSQPPPQKYLIGQVRDYVSFYQYDGKFYEELKEEVEKKIPRTSRQFHWQLYLKCIVIVPLYFYCLYWYIVSCTLVSAVCLGFVAAQVGVNVMHDGNHAAFSQNKWISLIAGYTLDLTFSTSVVYRRSHNFGHHGCVNHYELDRSFDTTYPLMRLHPLQPRAPFHKLQHIYIWLIYGLANFGDLFGTFDEMYWMSNFPTRRGHLTKKQVVMQIMVKLSWITLCMIIPSYLHGWFNIFPIWLAHIMSHSYGYTLFFAVNHWTVEAGIVDNENINEVNWGALQVTNSSNFDTKSKFWTHLVGGLNYQIEHHLFPQFSHTRLPEIQEIVKRHSLKHNLRYFEFPSFWTAIKSHYSLLKILGSQDDFTRDF